MVCLAMIERRQEIKREEKMEGRRSKKEKRVE